MVLFWHFESKFLYLQVQGIESCTKFQISQEIKNHQVPNVERVRKNDQNDPNFASEPQGFQTKSTKFSFFQPDLWLREKKYYAIVKDTIDWLVCLNYRVVPF